MVEITGIEPVSETLHLVVRAPSKPLYPHNNPSFIVACQLSCASQEIRVRFLFVQTAERPESQKTVKLIRARTRSGIPFTLCSLKAMRSPSTLNVYELHEPLYHIRFYLSTPAIVVEL